MSRWFESQPSDSAPPEQGSSIEDPAVHSSLALNVLFHQIRPGRKYHILDLGPALGPNVEFFSQFSCKIYIEDLYDSLSSFDYLSPEDGISSDKVFDYLLPFARTTRFDIILTWDILNHLEPDAFQGLMRHLGRFCRRGTMLFSLIWTPQHIHDKPHHFRIIDNHNLLYEPQSAVLKTCPRLGQTDLQRMMPYFRVTNSFQLRNGVREYIFTFE